MSRPKVFVTRKIPDKGLDMVRAACDVTLWEDELPPPYEVIKREVANVDGLLCLLTDRIDAELIRSGAQLKVISQFAVGFDNIDVQAATAAGIPVGNTPGVLTDTTADFAFTLLMAGARRVVEGEYYVKAGKWKTWGPTLLMGHDIHGATLGIIGMGRIGQAMAKRAAGFDMRILYYDQTDVPASPGAVWERRELEDLLAESDFVSLHTPLTPETQHLINADSLKLMKSTAVLINTARGPIVDPDALYDALQSGTIAYAALDVTEPEPLPADSPLLTLDNCLIVPHIASSSIGTRNKMATMAAENLIAGLQGKRLPNCANPQVYEMGK